MHQKITPTLRFANHLYILGFGSIGKALLPVIFQKIALQPQQITIIDRDDSAEAIAREYQVAFIHYEINAQNYQAFLGAKLQANDFLVDLSYNISSTDLIKLCDKHGALYINTSTEAWYEEWHVPKPVPASHTNYFLREQTSALKGQTRKTAILTHGANPGLISHLVKQALLNMAQDAEISVNTPQNSSQWAELAATLGIKTIHIAERDTQISGQPKALDEFVNTWSVYGLRDESVMPAELGWGTHERHWPKDAQQHTTGPQCAIYLTHPGAMVRARSWTPSRGAYHGWVISHAESTTLPDYLTVKEHNQVVYRPTVHYVYDPCPDARDSLRELSKQQWIIHEKTRLMLQEITTGQDELGVLLMGNPKGAYWFGSTLSIEQARAIVPYNNATSLQVAAGVIAAMMWAIEHPDVGVIEPEDIDHHYIMNVALPYLGKVSGHYTDWTPLQNRDLTLPALDQSDPWQFVNIRVD